MGVRANLAATLAIGAFDVVHGFEPGLPSLSSAALLEAETTTAATFFSTERIAVPAAQEPAREAARPRRRAARHLGRARSSARPSAFPATTRRSRSASTSELFAPGAKRKVDRRRARARAERRRPRPCSGSCRTLPGWEVVLARTAPLTRRPTIPVAASRRSRPHAVARQARGAPHDARRGGRSSSRRRAAARGCCSRRRPRGARSPSRPGSPISPSSRRRPSARLAEDDGAPRERRRRGARAAEASIASTHARRAARERLHDRGQPAATESRPPTQPTATRSPTATGSSSTSTCTRTGRTTARSSRRALIDHAEAEGLGAIAVTDHNVFGGALETVELAPRPRADRDPRRGGEDRQPGRGDRPLPRARRSRAG